jgi:hypothetical protein
VRRSAVRLAFAAAIACAVSLVPVAGALAAAPTCVGSHHVAIDSVVQFPGGACTDPDPGDTLTYSVVDWPTGGSLVGNTTTGQATYTAFGGTTEDSFTFRASDGQSFSNTAEMTIEVPPPPGGNRPPECPDSDLFVSPFPSPPAVLDANCADPERDPLTYGIADFPNEGTFQILGASTVSYAPGSTTISDSFIYTATDGFHPTVSATVSITVVAGNVFETATEATLAEPFAASIDSPGGGPVLVDARAVTEPPPDGFLLLNQEFDIEAPPASIEDPLRLVFKIDGSAAPAGRLDVFRDISTNPDPLPDCDTGGTASPDPCVLSRVGAPPDDVEVTVLTSHASRWNLGVGTPYDFSGFFAPVNNQPALNSANAGRAIPVKFSLNGDMGLDILAPGYPRSQAVDCAANAPVDGIESTVTPGSSALSYDAGSDRYTYVWKTDKSWDGCRQLVVKLTDGSKHRANFKFR